MKTCEHGIGGKQQHFGFECETAAKSLRLSEKYEKCLNTVEKELKIVTSTPKGIMDVSFTKCFREALLQGNSSAVVVGSIVLDNDSGYVSTNPESNIEYPTVNMSESCGSSAMKPVYLSEDALLEKPEICQQQTEHEYGHLYYLTDSVVAASCETETTVFSGLEEEDNDEESGVERDASNESLVIPVITPLKASVNMTRDAPNCSDLNSTVDESVPCKPQSPKDVISNQTVRTPERAYKNPVSSDISPDLFSDEDEPPKVSERHLIQGYCEKYVHPNDQKLIKRVQQGLSGVYPPPSVTIVYMSVEEMLHKINENKHLFADGSSGSGTLKKSLLVTENSETAVMQGWPFVLEQRYHGLLYNRSKLSEQFEQLCIKYGQRYVGAETQSSCTVFETNTTSPTKRKSTKLRWSTKSPGRRLSHLARRRITFNNPVLQNSGTSSNMVCSRARQILVDARRLELLSRRKSPRKVSPRKTPRKTPRKSPRVKGRTPSSSAKKRLALQFRMYSEEEAVASTSSSSFKANVTKRALFQSPDRDGGALASCSSSAFSVSSFSKKTTPKRALFSSPKKSSPSKCSGVSDRKRKRIDEEDNQRPQSSKLVRSVSSDVVQACDAENAKASLQRRPSECSSVTSSRNGELSAHHKKKLQWAVYEALKSRSIGISHPKFKTYASVLARVTRRFLPNLSANVPRPEGGTSEKMLRIARQHVHAVISGKSVDEIVLEVEVNKNKARRPVGYVGPGDKIDVSHAKNDKENLSQQKNVNDENVKPKHLRQENKIDRIRKVIDFGDDTETEEILR